MGIIQCYRKSVNEVLFKTTMNTQSAKQTQANNVFQRIEDSYRILTYMIQDYLGETRPPQKDGPTKADLKKLMEQCRANLGDCDEPKRVCTRIADLLPIKKYL